MIKSESSFSFVDLAIGSFFAKRQLFYWDLNQTSPPLVPELVKIYRQFQEDDGQLSFSSFIQAMKADLLLMELNNFFRKKALQSWSFTDSEVTIEFKNQRPVVLSRVENKILIKDKYYDFDRLFDIFQAKTDIDTIKKDVQIKSLIDSLVADNVAGVDLLRAFFPTSSPNRLNFWSDLKTFLLSPFALSLQEPLDTVKIDEVDLRFDQLFVKAIASQTAPQEDLSWIDGEETAAKQFHLLFDKVISVNAIKLAFKQIYWQHLRTKFIDFDLSSQLETEKQPWLRVDLLEIDDVTYSLDALIALRNQKPTTLFADPTLQSQPLQLKALNDNGVTVAQIEAAIRKLYWTQIKTALVQFATLPPGFVVNFNDQDYAFHELFALKDQVAITTDNQLANNQLSLLIDNHVPLNDLENLLLNKYWSDLKIILFNSVDFIKNEKIFLTIEDKKHSLARLNEYQFSLQTFSGLERILKALELDPRTPPEKITITKDGIKLIKHLAKEFSLEEINDELALRQYWPQFQTFLQNFVSLPADVIIANQVYLMFPLWENREFIFTDKDFAWSFDRSSQSPFIQDFLTQLRRLVKNAVTIQELNTAIERIADFWTQLQATLDKYSFVADDLNVVLDGNRYLLNSLFALKGDNLTVAQLPLVAKNQLFSLLRNDITIPALDAQLQNRQRLVTRFANLFINYSGITVSDLLVKNRVYDVSDFFVAALQSNSASAFLQHNAWKRALNQKQNFNLFTALVEGQFTFDELETFLNSANLASKQLFNQIRQLLPFWESAKQFIAFTHRSGNKIFPTLHITKLITEIGKDKTVAWEQIVASSKQLPNNTDFVATIALLNSLTSWQNGNLFLQLLLWNPLQRWLTGEFANFVNFNLVIEEKKYNLSSLFTQKTKDYWNKLNFAGKETLKTLVTDQISPSQLKNALKLANNQASQTKTPTTNQQKSTTKTTPKRDKIDSLSLGLITIGGAIGVVGVGSLIYWLIKRR